MSAFGWFAAQGTAQRDPRGASAYDLEELPSCELRAQIGVSPSVVRLFPCPSIVSDANTLLIDHRHSCLTVLFRGSMVGDLKIRSYFAHVLASPDFAPRLRSRLDQTGIAGILIERQGVRCRFMALRASRRVLRVGRHWLMPDQQPEAGANIPVVSLAQHVRHA